MKYEFRIFLLFLYVSIIYHPFKRDYLVHVITACLKIKRMLKSLYFKFVMKLLSIMCDALFKIKSNVLSELFLDYIWKRIWQLKLGENNLFE